MDHMDMSGGGMDMGGVSMFKVTNMGIARLYWYLVAAVVAVLGLRRLVEWGRRRHATKFLQRQPNAVPSRPNDLFSQVYDTLNTICRELAYSQPYWLHGKFTRYLNLPSLGKCILLLSYWIVLLIFLWTNTILTPSSPDYAYKWEIVGFRAAWVSVTQLPLIYCLSCKINVISLITGISYERLNWFHRWAARTLFLTVIVHWSYFFREWSIANFVSLELSMMPMVKYGFGAWAVIGWMIITGFGYFRTLSYELFVLQHIAAAAVLLWLVHVHVPSYAAYNVWLAIGFVAFDWAARAVSVLVRNLHVPAILAGKRLRRRVVGYPGQVEVLSHDYLSIIVEGVDFSWRPGQHMYITIPRCGLFGFFEAHPFTIANAPTSLSDSGRGHIKFFFKAHSGFTKRLLNHCLKGEDRRSLRVFLNGPWGSPPLDVVQRSDSLILFATSTGASFTLPILQSSLFGTSSIRRIRFYWIVRPPSQIAWFEEELNSALAQARSKRIDLIVRIFVTSESESRKMGPWRPVTDSDPRRESNLLGGLRTLLRQINITPTSTSTSEKHLLPSDLSPSPPISPPKPHAHLQTISTVSSTPSNTTSSSFTNSPSILTQAGRPTSLDVLIRPTVEESDGETAIVACGNGSLLFELRNYTAALSDERAVHKGTGAQGIFLFTENYGW